MTQDAARISPRYGIDSTWLFFAVQANCVRNQIMRDMVGATVKGINIRDLKRCCLPVPPHHEQVDIGRFLTQAATLLTDVTNRTVESINALHEYRQTLITAAVTGKIPIPHGAPQ